MVNTYIKKKSSIKIKVEYRKLTGHVGPQLNQSIS